MDEMEVQFTSAVELAQMLINNDVMLSELNSIAAFAAKADNTEEATWALCKNANNYSRYLEIYPNGKHKSEVEELMWENAADIPSLITYKDNYPQGVHVSELDDRVWNIAKATGGFYAYLLHFPDGKHAEEARKILNAAEADEEDWQKANIINTQQSYQNYIDTHQYDGQYVSLAKDRIKEIIIKQKENIIRKLSEDSNAYSLVWIKNAGITKEDLMGKIKDSHGIIRDEVLRSWDNIPRNLTMGNTPTHIPKGSTEVYFWGVPGSGKTCAMAAILSRARQMGCFEPREGEGIGYMNQLASIFTTEANQSAVLLPPGSDVDTTQYLPLTLNEIIEGRNGRIDIKQHDLSVIEISGEIFECFSREIQGLSFPTDEHKRTYEQLKAYLKSEDNPKYHFFIIDSQPLSNADQMTCLQNAALYFKKSGIFNATTQGISLIVTKSDVLSPHRKEWAKCATQAARDNFYSLVTQLKVIIGDKGLGLSDGTLQVIPLSIGEVFFNSLCIFDPAPAETLVKLLIEYSKVAENNDWRSRIRRTLRR